jgi:hypothetical protein
VSGPNVEQTEQLALGPEAQQLIATALHLYCEELSPLAAEAVVSVLNGGPVAALVAAAEERGIAAALLAVDPVEWALAGQHAGVEAAKIVRGES